MPAEYGALLAGLTLASNEFFATHYRTGGKLSVAAVLPLLISLAVRKWGR